MGGNMFLLPPSPPFSLSLSLSLSFRLTLNDHMKITILRRGHKEAYVRSESKLHMSKIVLLQDIKKHISITG